jgi:hypothetical protein
LPQYLTALPEDVHLAVEATGNWMWLYEQIKDRQLDLVLAHLLRQDLLPTAYIPPRTIRDQRELLRYRMSLVRVRTQVKNKIAAI